MELKRVLFNKKTLIAFILLIAVCVGFYLNSEYQHGKLLGSEFSYANSFRLEMLEKMKGKSLTQSQKYINDRLDTVTAICSLMNLDVMKAENYREYKDYWLDTERELRGSYPEVAKEYDKNKKGYSRAEYEAEKEVLIELSSQAEYAAEYHTYLSDIDAKARRLNAISIFSNNNSLSKINIDKTAEDYAPLKDISLSLGNDKPLSTVLDFELVHYLILIFSILIILRLLNERKKGLWNVIFSTPKGRFSLALRRAGILTVSVTAVTVLMYTALFSASFILYGTDDIFRNVQSIEMFKNFIFPMSEIEFIFFYVFVNIITQLALAFIFWFIISFIQNRSISFCILGIIFAVEFSFYTFLPIQSNIAILKCFNVFYFINPTAAVIKYCNLNAFFLLINLFWLVIISSLITAISFAVLSILTTSKKYPCKTANRLEAFILKLFNKVALIYRKLIEKLSVMGTEAYKIFILQKGFIVLAVFIYVLFSSVTVGELYYSGVDSIVNDFYDKYSGPVTKEAEKYLSDLEAECRAVDDEMVKADSKYREKKISYDDYMNVVHKFEAYDIKREALQVLQKQFEYIQNNKTSGTDSWLVNPNGYNNLLNEEGFSRQQNFSLLSVFCIIIMLSGAFAFEKRSMTYSTIKSTFGGRQYLFHKKIIVATFITVVVWACACFFELFDVCSQYTLTQFNAPLKSLEFLNSLPINCSLGTFLIFLYITRFILLLSMAYIVCLISSLTSYEMSLVISSVILIIPSLLYVVGIDMFAYISAVVPVASMKLLLSSNGFAFFIPIIIVILLGVFSVIMTKRIWCNESRCKNAA